MRKSYKCHHPERETRKNKDHMIVVSLDFENAYGYVPPKIIEAAQDYYHIHPEYENESSEEKVVVYILTEHYNIARSGIAPL